MARIAHQDNVYFGGDLTDPEIIDMNCRAFWCRKGEIFVCHLLEQHKNIDDTPTTSQLSQACITMADRKSNETEFWFGCEERIFERDWLVCSLFADFLSRY